jgi:hypothetical protein
MFTHLMNDRTAWDDFFTGNPTIIQQKEFGTQQTPSGTKVYVSKCLFKTITSGSNGGALSCTSATEMLVESSSFFSIKTSGQYGGAIFFSNSGGQCVLYAVCGYDCYSTYTSYNSYGQFVRTIVNSDLSSKNYVNYSSIVHCISEISNSYRMLYLDYGKISCESVNVSMNKCYYETAVIYRPFSNSAICSITYSSFTNNIATYYTCIRLATECAKLEIRCCNILRNAQGSLDSCGTINTEKNTTIENSCILENTATYIFYQEYSSYTITLSKCTVDSTSNNRNLIIQNTVTRSFILALNHMSTRNCHSEYDSAGYLTPIIQSPSSSKKQMHCCTCGRMFYPPLQGNLVSLTSVLVLCFNFIHLDVSSDPLF